MTLNERSHKGEKAQSMLDNEIFSDALVNLRAAIVDKWRTCSVRDVEGQHELKLMDKLLTDLEANIKAFVQDGKVARFEIESQRKRDEQTRKIARAQGR